MGVGDGVVIGAAFDENICALVVDGIISAARLNGDLLGVILNVVDIGAADDG